MTTKGKRPVFYNIVFCKKRVGSSHTSEATDDECQWLGGAGQILSANILFDMILVKQLYDIMR